MNKNIYHRYVKLPFEHKFPDCFKAKPENMRGENWHEWCATREHWDERFVDWLKEYGLKPSNVCEAFYNGPNGGGLPMHNDAPTLNNSSNINFTTALSLVNPKLSLVKFLLEIFFVSSFA